MRGVELSPSPPRRFPLPRRLPLPRTVPQVGLALLILTYVAGFSWWTVQNHDGFGTAGFDLGIYDQGLWLLSRFHAPFITIMGRNLFGDHTSFILLPLVPLYWVVPSAKTLLVLQSAALGLTALPVFLIARRKLGDEWLALVLAAVTLLQPTLQWTNFEEFHPDSFEPVLVCFVLYFLFEHRWTPYFVSVALLLSVKEDTPLLVVVIGLYVFLRHDRKIGLITAGAAVGYGVLAVFGVLRVMNGVGSLNGWRIPFGGMGGLLRTTFTHPGRLLDYLRSDTRPWYLWQLFAPLALLSLVAPDILLLAIGPLAANLVSNYYYQHRIAYHYSTTIAPVLVVAAVVAISRLRRETLRSVGVGVMGAVALWTAYLWGPMPGAVHPFQIADANYPTIPYVERAFATIPPGASVSAYYGYVTHLEHRREIYDFPVPWRAQYWGTLRQEGQRLPQADDVQYVVVPPQLPDPAAQAVLESIKPQFRLVYRSPYVLIFERR